MKMLMAVCVVLGAGACASERSYTFHDRSREMIALDLADACREPVDVTLRTASDGSVSATFACALRRVSAAEAVATVCEAVADMDETERRAILRMLNWDERCDRKSGVTP